MTDENKATETGQQSQTASVNSKPKSDRKRICERISNQFIICIIVSLVALVLLYVINGLFFWTSMRDKMWAVYLQHDIKYFNDTKDLIGYKPPIADLMLDLAQIGTTSPKGPPPSELQILIERANKPEEGLFSLIALLLFLGGHLLVFLPFLVRLKAKFRSWYMYLSVMYGISVLLCLIGASAEIASVHYTDQAYHSVEDLAQNGSVGALMLASCQLRSNEFHRLIQKKPMYVEFRDRTHVCQDSKWKLLAAILLYVVMILHLSIAIVLCHHFAYLVRNNIYPRSQLELEQKKVQRDQMVTQIWYHISNPEEDTGISQRKRSSHPKKPEPPPLESNLSKHHLQHKHGK